jgi:8-hydroxy-5-deazaflavin:NADPH oxidoreductase
VNIGIIGSGRMATTLGRNWTGKGHRIMFGSRQPEKENGLAEMLGSAVSIGTIAQAVEFGDVVLLAVPNRAVAEVITAAQSLAGKIVIDCTNAFSATADGPRLPMGEESSAAEEVARLAVGAHVVKAFNTNFSQLIQSGAQAAGESSDTFYCGDDVHAKKTVAQLAHDAGFRGVDIGPLNMARFLESFAVIMVSLARLPGGSPKMGYKVLFS